VDQKVEPRQIRYDYALRWRAEDGKRLLGQIWHLERFLTRSFLALERMQWCVVLAGGFVAMLQRHHPRLREMLERQVRPDDRFVVQRATRPSSLLRFPRIWLGRPSSSRRCRTPTASSDGSPGKGARLPNPHLLIRPFVRHEAVLSSRIEGTQATLGAILAAGSDLLLVRRSSRVLDSSSRLTRLLL
jgi:hypothetical protein